MPVMDAIGGIPGMVLGIVDGMPGMPGITPGWVIFYGDSCITHHGTKP